MAKIELADGFAEMASTLPAVEVDFGAVHALAWPALSGLADVVTIELDGSESTYLSGPHPDGLDAGDRNPMSVAP
jgi:hypothetical protein